MARKKKPALHSSDSSPEIDEAEVTLDPYFPPESEPWPEPTLQVEPTVKPIKQEAPEPTRTGVKLEVFLRVAGPKPDQLAGFRRWAMDNGLKQMDVENWRAEYEKFLRRPV